MRKMAVAQSLFAPTTLAQAIQRLGFVQADPIRAPARAQDLTLRHRVTGYQAGDLEANYVALGVEEDFFVNYGFVTPELYALMHPRVVTSARSAMVEKLGPAVLDFIRERGAVHPREVDAHFAHGSTTNAWGGQSSLSTHLLDSMQYRGILRVAGRERGIRLYALPKIACEREDIRNADATLDQMIDVLLNKYAPLPQKSLCPLLARLHHATPQWRDRLSAAVARVAAQAAQTTIDGATWFLPKGAQIPNEVDDEVRLLTPFDPVVWDRTRFEMLWGWAYRFEAYTPAAKRKLGYYALPMLWRDQVIGWANVSAQARGLSVQTGYASGAAPKDKKFRSAFNLECERMAEFLKLPGKT